MPRGLLHFRLMHPCVARRTTIGQQFNPTSLRRQRSGSVYHLPFTLLCQLRRHAASWPDLSETLRPEVWSSD